MRISPLWGSQSEDYLNRERNPRSSAFRTLSVAELSMNEFPQHLPARAPCFPCFFLALLAFLLGVSRVEAAPRIKILFLGDNGHHRPAERFRQLQPVLEKRGIDLTYTDKVEALTPKVLAGYDGLIVYANTTKIAPEQEKALLDFVESGKGFIPIHC